MLLQYEAAHLDALFQCVFNDLGLLNQVADCMSRLVEFKYLNALCEGSRNQGGGLEYPGFEKL